MTKKVIVTDISDKAGEKTVKDFFLFCGKIKEFELIKEESSDKQIAYVTFERDTAAKTALMLTNAVIGDSQITVKSVDDGPGGSDDFDENDSDESKANKLAEILAAGYSLQDAIIEKGVEFDARYGVLCTLKEYLLQLQNNLKNLDQKYQLTETVTTRATDINKKYSVLDKAHYVYDQTNSKVNNFLETSTGRILHEYFNCTTKQVFNVQYMARQIADNKKQDRSYNPASSHSHSDDQEPISAQ